MSGIRYLFFVIVFVDQHVGDQVRGCLRDSPRQAKRGPGEFYVDWFGFFGDVFWRGVAGVSPYYNAIPHQYAMVDGELGFGKVFFEVCRICSCQCYILVTFL